MKKKYLQPVVKLQSMEDDESIICASADNLSKNSDYAEYTEDEFWD